MERKETLGIIGLDGMDYYLTKEMFERNELPNLKSLSYDNEPHKIETSLPASSASVWTTYATGVNPGVHGIIDFFKTGSALRLHNSLDISLPRVWDVLTKKGLRSLVFNVPLTYPPKPLNGVMVSGVLTPDNKGATYPENIKKFIQPYIVEPALDFKHTLGKDVTSDIINSFTLRYKAFLKILQNEDFDFFFSVFNILDRMSHFKYGTEALQLAYKLADKMVGEIIKKYPESSFIILSDHGFRPVHTYFFIEEWLRQKGLVKVSLSNELIPESFIKFAGKFGRLIPENRNFHRKIYHSCFRNKVKYHEESPAFFYSNSGRFLLCKPSEKYKVFFALKQCPYIQDVCNSESIHRGDKVEPRAIFINGKEGYEIVSGFGKLTVPSKDYKFFPPNGAHRWKGAICISNDENLLPRLDVEVTSLITEYFYVQQPSRIKLNPDDYLLVRRGG